MEIEQFPSPPPRPAAPELLLHFKAGKYFSGPLLVLFLGITGGLIFAFFRHWAAASSWFPFIIAGCLIAAALTLALLRNYTWVRQVPPVRFTHEGITLPRTARSAHTVFVPYNELTSIDLRGRGTNEVLVIGSTKSHFVYPLDIFEGTSDEIHARLEQAFRYIPPATWPALQDRQALTADFMARKTRATWGLLMLLIAVYLLQGAMGATSDVLTLIAMGGNAPALVSAGEWSRLFTASFLHANLLHIYFNGIAILTLGSILERVSGSIHFTLVFLVSCLAGTFTSYLFSDALVSVGASTGVFGLLGAFAVVNLTLGHDLPAGFAQTRTWWVVILLLNAALPFFVPQIDWRAHAGGFVAGLSVMWLLLQRKQAQTAALPLSARMHVWRSASVAVRAVTVVLGAVYITAIADIALSWDERQQNIDTATMTAFVRDQLAADLVNAAAWSVVVDERRSTEALVMAEARMQPIINAILANASDFPAASQAAYLDTWASIQFLNENFEDAVLRERQAMQLSAEQFFASQFSRFLAAYNRRSGVLATGTVDAAEFNLATVMTDAGNARVTITRRDNRNDPVTVVVHVWDGPLRKGYVICRMTELDSKTVFDNVAFRGSKAQNLRFELAMLDSGNARTTNGDSCITMAVDGADTIQSPG